MSHKHTGVGYLADAVVCEEGLALQTELLYLRHRQRKMYLEHPCLPAAVVALERRNGP